MDNQVKTDMPQHPSTHKYETLKWYRDLKALYRERDRDAGANEEAWEALRQAIEAEQRQIVELTSRVADLVGQIVEKNTRLSTQAERIKGLIEKLDSANARANRLKGQEP